MRRTASRIRLSGWRRERKKKKRTKPDFQTGSYHRESPKIGAATRGSCSRAARGGTPGAYRGEERRSDALFISLMSATFIRVLFVGGEAHWWQLPQSPPLFFRIHYLFFPDCKQQLCRSSAVVRTARGPDVHEEQLQPNTSSHFRVGVLLTSAQSSPHLGP